MDIKEFKNYTKNLSYYNASEIDELEEMTDAELDWYQNELETESGNLSDWDHIRAVISFRKRISHLEDAIK